MKVSSLTPNPACRRQERLELGEAVELIEAVKNILREYNNMVELEAPVRRFPISWMGSFGGEVSM